MKRRSSLTYSSRKFVLLLRMVTTSSRAVSVKSSLINISIRMSLSGSSAVSESIAKKRGSVSFPSLILILLWPDDSKELSINVAKVVAVLHHVSNDFIIVDYDIASR